MAPSTRLINSQQCGALNAPVRTAPFLVPQPYGKHVVRWWRMYKDINWEITSIYGLRSHAPIIRKDPGSTIFPAHFRPSRRATTPPGQAGAQAQPEESDEPRTSAAGSP